VVSHHGTPIIGSFVSLPDFNSSERRIVKWRERMGSLVHSEQKSSKLLNVTDHTETSVTVLLTVDV
jgi:hypothetical protein